MLVLLHFSIWVYLNAKLVFLIFRLCLSYRVIHLNPLLSLSGVPGHVRQDQGRYFYSDVAVSYLLCQVFNLLPQLSSHRSGIWCPFYKRLILLCLLSESCCVSQCLQSQCQQISQSWKLLMLWLSRDVSHILSCWNNMMCLLQHRVVLCVSSPKEAFFTSSIHAVPWIFLCVCNRLLFSQHEIQISSQCKCECLHSNCVINRG